MNLGCEIIGAVKIKDGLFVGDEIAAQDLEFVLANKVTHIINCCGRHVGNHWEAIGVIYLSYHWMDTDNQIILDGRDIVVCEIHDFIEEALEQGESVLVHSMKGQSRSCCVVAAYLMKKYHWSLRKTMEFLCSRRPDLNLKPAFLQQLCAFERRLITICGKQSVDWNIPAHIEQNYVRRLLWADYGADDRGRLEQQLPNSKYRPASAALQGGVQRERETNANRGEMKNGLPKKALKGILKRPASAPPRQTVMGAQQQQQLQSGVAMQPQQVAQQAAAPQSLYGTHAPPSQPPQANGHGQPSLQQHSQQMPAERDHVSFQAQQPQQTANTAVPPFQNANNQNPPRGAKRTDWVGSAADVPPSATVSISSEKDGEALSPEKEKEPPKDRDRQSQQQQMQKKGPPTSAWEEKERERPPTAQTGSTGGKNSSLPQNSSTAAIQPSNHANGNGGLIVRSRTPTVSADAQNQPTAPAPCAAPLVSSSSSAPHTHQPTCEVPTDSHQTITSAPANGENVSAGKLTAQQQAPTTATSLTRPKPKTAFTEDPSPASAATRQQTTVAPSAAKGDKEKDTSTAQSQTTTQGLQTGTGSQSASRLSSLSSLDADYAPVPVGGGSGNSSAANNAWGQVQQQTSASGGGGTTSVGSQGTERSNSHPQTQTQNFMEAADPRDVSCGGSRGDTRAPSTAASATVPFSQASEASDGPSERGGSVSRGGSVHRDEREKDRESGRGSFSRLLSAPAPAPGLFTSHSPSNRAPPPGCSGGGEPEQIVQRSLLGGGSDGTQQQRRGNERERERGGGSSASDRGGSAPGSQWNSLDSLHAYTCTSVGGEENDSRREQRDAWGVDAAVDRELSAGFPGRERERERDGGAYREGERENREREREIRRREKERDREGGERDRRDRERDRGDRERDREKDRHRERGSRADKDRDRDRERDRDGERERGKDRDRERELQGGEDDRREKERDREREKDKEALRKEKEREREERHRRRREREKEKDRREREKERERERERDSQNNAGDYLVHHSADQSPSSNIHRGSSTSNDRDRDRDRHHSRSYERERERDSHRQAERDERERGRTSAAPSPAVAADWHHPTTVHGSFREERDRDPYRDRERERERERDSRDRGGHHHRRSSSASAKERDRDRDREREREFSSDRERDREVPLPSPPSRLIAQSPKHRAHRGASRDSSPASQRRAGSLSSDVDALAAWVAGVRGESPVRGDRDRDRDRDRERDRDGRGSGERGGASRLSSGGGGGLAKGSQDSRGKLMTPGMSGTIGGMGVGVGGVGGFGIPSVRPAFGAVTVGGPNNNLTVGAPLSNSGGNSSKGAKQIPNQARTSGPVKAKADLLRPSSSGVPPGGLGGMGGADSLGGSSDFAAVYKAGNPLLGLIAGGGGIGANPLMGAPGSSRSGFLLGVQAQGQGLGPGSRSSSAGRDREREKGGRDGGAQLVQGQRERDRGSSSGPGGGGSFLPNSRGPGSSGRPGSPCVHLQQRRPSSPGSIHGGGSRPPSPVPKHSAHGSGGLGVANGQPQPYLISGIPTKRFLAGHLK
eukprot:Cvel_13495.t1-p1 / transcript=Cvel_13495.t1 / gene=Cvel_13495 / organism=Chromera_velia_CCMP2878 / gene_product=Dual specificity protein phosphatase 1B, putative / transcript_product=Dual specificity protein phosphatase 1B, putative / location=Cvel_scaffold923:45383-53053(+) / protein_length=1548 / sequence_SO=supercontig / SO=protein_coding / is_pseudo=false